jgi:chromate transporter
LSYRIPLVAASGTPITNSLAELFTLQRFIQPDAGHILPRIARALERELGLRLGFQRGKPRLLPREAASPQQRSQREAPLWRAGAGLRFAGLERAGTRWRTWAAAFALAQIMPGASVVNLSALIGYRLMRLPGALAAVAGLLIGPGVAAIGLASLAHHWAGWTLSAALQGMAASAAGLLFSMGLKTGNKMVHVVFSSAGQEAEGVAALSVLTATFVLVGLFRFPTAVVVLCLAPCSVALAFLARKKGRR